MRISTLVALFVSCCLHGFAAAQSAVNYPDKPVRIIVPFAIASPTDIIARVVASQLTQAFKQPFTVEDRRGAGGLIGTEYVAKATADGYTVLVSNATSLAAGMSAQAKVPYDVLANFAPVSLLSDTTIVLAVHATAPVSSVRELVALARARSGGLNAALPGRMGTIEHLLTELFRQRTGIDIEVVPYKVGGRALLDTMSGQAHMSFLPLPTAREFVKAGRLKVIAIASAQRTAQLPDVPTMSEAGHPEVVGASWTAMLVQTAAPREVVIRLNAHIVRIMRTPEMIQDLGAKGTNARSSTPEEAHAFIRSEIDKWSAVVKVGGLKLE